jgi:hypothetical protein
VAKGPPWSTDDALVGAAVTDTVAAARQTLNGMVKPLEGTNPTKRPGFAYLEGTGAFVSYPGAGRLVPLSRRAEVLAWLH